MNDIKVIYEDEDILVLDKPSGVTVNKAETTKGEFTVQDWLENKFAIHKPWLEANREGDFYKRAGFVHRIDKETSGILLVSKNANSFADLQAQFKDRRVEKTYVALVHGHVDAPEGEIIVPVGRLPWNRKRFGVLAGGKEATTHYRIVEKFSRTIYPFGIESQNRENPPNQSPS